MPTIKDVAQKAGVSASTVSRVIADSPRISAATKERVRAAMRELGYHPNAIARSLVRRRSKSLGLILSRSTEAAMLNPFFPEVIRGIGSVARRARYSLLLSTSSTPAEERAECLAMLQERRADGVILLASRWNDPLVDRLREEDYPFVVVGRVPDDEGVLWVNNDNVAAAREATAHLIGLGHRRIGFIGGPPELIVSHDRLSGYRQALCEAGLEVDERLVRTTQFSLEEGVAAALALFETAPDMTAVVCVDDVLALGVMQAAANTGRQIPAGLSVVGFNDNPLSAYLSPPLTTVQIPIFDIGAAAARLLIDRLHGETTGGGLILPAPLIVRASTGPRPEGGRERQAAQRIPVRRDGSIAERRPRRLGMTQS